MTHMLIRHQVADFEKWKLVYEDHRPARESGGLKDLHLWRNTGDPSDVLLVFEVLDLEKAKEFAASSELKQAMQAAGVQGETEIVFFSDG